MDLGSIIREAAARHNVPPELMLRIAQIESGMNPNAANPSSSARGLYQFLTKPGGSWDTYGRGQNPLDPVASADAGARYIRDNTQALQNRLGRPPAPWEVYLAHQQGAGGAPALLNNPNQNAVATLSSVYKNPNTARDAVVLNAGNANMTSGDFANLWKAKYEGTAVPASSAGETPIAAAPPNAAPPMTTGSVAIDRPTALSSIFTDVLQPLAQQPTDPKTLVRKPKSVETIIGELGQPVELSV